MPLSPSRLNILSVCFSAFCLCLTLLHGAPLRAQGFEVWSSGQETEGIWDLHKAQTGPRDFDVSRLPAGHYTVTIEGAKSSKALATLVKLQ